MARITVEDCLVKENNRFALVQLAAKRAKQLLHGGKPVLGEDKGNRAVVTALREIAAGMVAFMTAEEAAQLKERQANVEKKQEEIVPERQAGPITRVLRPPLLAVPPSDDDDEDRDEEVAIEDVQDRNGDRSSGL